MTYEAAQILTEMTGIGEIYGDYKGKGEWKEATAVTFESEQDLMNAVAAIMEVGSLEERKLIAHELRYIKCYSLGKSFIYY